MIFFNILNQVPNLGVIGPNLGAKRPKLKTQGSYLDQGTKARNTGRKPRCTGRPLGQNLETQGPNVGTLGPNLRTKNTRTKPRYPWTKPRTIVSNLGTSTFIDSTRTPGRTKPRNKGTRQKGLIGQQLAGLTFNLSFQSLIQSDSIGSLNKNNSR